MNFSISANIKNKSYFCNIDLSDEQNKIFTDLGLKNYTEGQKFSDVMQYNKSVIQNFDAETLEFFNNKTTEMIKQSYSEYELYDVCFETAVMNPTHFV